MSALLDRAVAKVRELPAEEQDAVASIILDEIDDDHRWEESFAKSAEKLAAHASASGGIASS